MARALAPAKSVGFMCFMMWMVGSGIQLFSIIFTVTGITSPISAILKSGARKYSADDAGELRRPCCRPIVDAALLAIAPALPILSTHGDGRRLQVLLPVPHT